MTMKRFVCGAMAMAMLAAPALAAQEGTTSAQPPRVTVIAPKEESDGFTLSQWKKAFPQYAYGRVESMGENSITIKNSNEKDPFQNLVMNVGDRTIILDAVTGQTKSVKDIKQGESLVAWISPAVTMSLPPQAAAQVILCNIPADYAAPKYSEIQQVVTGEDGSLSVLTSDDVILRVEKDTKLMPYLTKNIILPADLQPGVRILAWYDVVQESFPAKAAPTKIMVFPSEYDGWFGARMAHELVLNGQKIEAQGYAKDGKLMVPVRAMAEALGCEVLWDAKAPNEVKISKDGKELYTLNIGAQSAVVDGKENVELGLPTVAQDGVSYMNADNFISLHNLKAEGQWPV